MLTIRFTSESCLLIIQIQGMPCIYGPLGGQWTCVTCKTIVFKLHVSTAEFEIQVKVPRQPLNLKREYVKHTWTVFLGRTPLSQQPCAPMTIFLILRSVFLQSNPMSNLLAERWREKISSRIAVLTWMVGFRENYILM